MTSPPVRQRVPPDRGLHGGHGADTFLFSQWEFVAAPPDPEGEPWTQEFFFVGWYDDWIKDFDPPQTCSSMSE